MREREWAREAQFSNNRPRTEAILLLSIAKFVTSNNKRVQKINQQIYKSLNNYGMECSGRAALKMLHLYNYNNYLNTLHQEMKTIYTILKLIQMGIADKGVDQNKMFGPV